MYHILLTQNLISAVGVAGAVPIDALVMGSVVNKIVDYIKAWMPDQMEGKYLMPCAIGIGIVICYFLAKMPLQEAITQGLAYGLVASGLAGGQKAVEKAHNGGNGSKPTSKAIKG